QIGVATVDTAPSSQNALESLSDNPADVVIVDLHMPDMDGLELLRRVRSDRRNNKIGFVMTSGDDSNEKIAEAWHDGLDRFLPKPFDMQRLIACLESIAGRI
ncbi:MAG: response regulator, partial [Paracoccaceae bacterium]